MNGTQDVLERQINDLVQVLASANNWTVEAVFAEKVSEQKRILNARINEYDKLYQSTQHT